MGDRDYRNYRYYRKYRNYSDYGKYGRNGKFGPAPTKYYISLPLREGRGESPSSLFRMLAQVFLVLAHFFAFLLGFVDFNLFGLLLQERQFGGVPGLLDGPVGA